jgi:hypothetical protein
LRQISRQIRYLHHVSEAVQKFYPCLSLGKLEIALKTVSSDSIRLKVKLKHKNLRFLVRLGKSLTRLVEILNLLLRN